MLYTVLGLGVMLKLATFVLNDIDHVWMSPEDTVTLKHTGKNQGNSAALNVTANDETSVESGLKFNIGQDGTPACGRIQQSIYMNAIKTTLYTNKYNNTLHERANCVLSTQPLL